MRNNQFSQLSQGQAKEMTDKDKEEMTEDAAIFPETYLVKQPGYQFSLKGIEPVEGKDAYVVQVKTPAGRQFTNFYDVNTGLLVKKMLVQEGPQGSMSVSSYVSDYKTFGGVKIPTKIVNDLGMMKFEITFNDVKVNSGLKAEDIQ